MFTVLVGLIGGGIVLLLVTILWDSLLFCRVGGDPVRQKLGAVAAAWITCSLIMGFVIRAASGSFAWLAFAVFLLPALAVALLAYRQGKAEARRRVRPDVASVFE